MFSNPASALALSDLAWVRLHFHRQRFILSLSWVSLLAFPSCVHTVLSLAGAPAAPLSPLPLLLLLHGRNGLPPLGLRSGRTPRLTTWPFHFCVQLNTDSTIYFFCRQKPDIFVRARLTRSICTVPRSHAKQRLTLYPKM